MQIQDYELINSIDVLFEKKIIIYGAGKYGIRSAKLLEKAGVGIYCFCDRDAGQKQPLGHRVIAPNELEVTIKKEDCMIVVGSKDYCDEIIEELARKEVKAYICTWYGLQTAIEVNIDDVRFLKAFQEDFKRKNELYGLLVRFNNYHKTVFTRMCQIVLPILVYQPGKVGSSTVFSTLFREGVDVIQIHYICAFDDADPEIAVMEEALAYFKKNLRTEGCKIITLVRDPLARALSLFMEEFGSDMYTSYHFDSGCSLAAKASEDIVKNLNNNNEFTWFDRELKEATGIDIYQYPFDKDKGYAWIKEGNIEILVLTLEKLNENVGVLGEFVGKPSIKLRNSNIGDEKQYKYIYEGLKKDIRIPAGVMESQYKNNSQMDHFYTEEEKERFLQKWRRYVSDEEVG